jgi:hypothetical protein
MRLVNTFAIIAVLLFSTQVFAQQAVVLNLKKGETYHLNQKSVSKVAQVISGMPQDSETITVQDTEFLVTGMSGKNYLIDMKPVRMSTTQKSAMGEMVMDSDGDVTDPMNKMMSNMVNKIIKIELTPYGEIVKFESNDYMSSMLDGVELPGQALEQIKAQMADTFSDEALSESYKYYFSIYPTSKVKVGDTWKSDYEMNAMLPIQTKMSNTFKSSDNNQITIQSNAELSTGGEKTTVLMGMDAKADLDGTMNTTYVLDGKTGWITAMDQKQNISGTMTLLKSAQIPEDMKIPMTIENTAVIGTE